MRERDAGQTGKASSDESRRRDSHAGRRTIRATKSPFMGRDTFGIRRDRWRRFYRRGRTRNTRRTRARVTSMRACRTSPSSRRATVRAPGTDRRRRCGPLVPTHRGCFPFRSFVPLTDTARVCGEKPGKEKDLEGVAALY